MKDCLKVAFRPCMTSRRIVGKKGHSTSTTVGEKGDTSSTASVKKNSSLTVDKKGNSSSIVGEKGNTLSITGVKENSLLIVGEKGNSLSTIGKKGGVKEKVLSTRKRKREGISKNWQTKDIDGEDKASYNRLIADMKAIMQKSESG